MPHRELFNPKRPLVAAREFVFAGISYSRGDPFPDPAGPPVTSFSRRLIERQYDTMAVNHAGEEDDVAESNDPVQMKPAAKNGSYDITAPWLEKPLTIRGKVNAEKAFAELREEGAPLGWIDGGTEVEIEEQGGGWYEITAPWLTEAEKVQGREAAETRQREIHDAGAPEQELDPVEGHAASVVISIDGSKRIVTAPWLDAPEEFDGDTADADAEARQAALREDGPPEGWEPSEKAVSENLANAESAKVADKGDEGSAGTDDAKKAVADDKAAKPNVANGKGAGKSKDGPANA